jgi:hypothetical protein
MRLSLSDPSESLTATLEQVVVFPDGSVTWAIEPPPERIPVVACEIVPEYEPLPMDLLRSPRPHQPEFLAVAPEFAPVLKPVKR